MSDGVAQPVGWMDEESFLALYGPWDPLTPEQVAELLSACGAGWWIAGGRAARLGALPRRHEDTDVMVLADDLDSIRLAMRDWHLWEDIDGSLRPLLPGARLTARCGQL